MITDKKCSVCGKSYKGYNSKHSFCKQCRATNKYNTTIKKSRKIKKTCSCCGKEYFGSNSKYSICHECGKSGGYARHAKSSMTVCGKCGEEFKLFDGRKHTTCLKCRIADYQHKYYTSKTIAKRIKIREEQGRVPAKRPAVCILCGKNYTAGSRTLYFCCKDCQKTRAYKNLVKGIPLKR